MRTLRYSIGALVALVLLEAPAQAQTRIEASTLVGGTWVMAEPPTRFAVRSDGSAADLVVTDGELAARNVSVSAIVGARFGPRFGVEGLLTWVPTQLKAPQSLASEGGSIDGDVLIYSATALHHFAESGPFKPFFGVGVGAQTTRFDREGWRGQTEPLVNLLAGGEIELGSGIALRLDARNCISPWKSRVSGADNAVRTDAIFSGGLTFSRPIGG